MGEKPVFSGTIWGRGSDAPWTSVSKAASPEKPLDALLKPGAHDGSVPVVPLVDIKVDIRPAENL